MTDNLLTRIDELERLRCAATSGPWERGGPYPGTSVIVCVDGGCTHPEFAEPPMYEPICILDQRQSGEPSERAIADADFIAAARNTTLLTEVRNEIVRLRQALSHYHCPVCDDEIEFCVCNDPELQKLREALESEYE